MLLKSVSYTYVVSVLEICNNKGNLARGKYLFTPLYLTQAEVSCPQHAL